MLGLSSERGLVPASDDRRLGASWPVFWVSRRFRLGRLMDLDLSQAFERPVPEISRGKYLNTRAGPSRAVGGRSDWTVKGGAE